MQKLMYENSGMTEEMANMHQIILEKKAREEKAFMAKQYFRQLISCRKVMKGRKAGRRKKL